MLYIVATPIGNLKDITLRALEVLREVDGIICEDTRRTSLLLNHYRIRKPLSVLNDFNEVRVVPTLIVRLKAGQKLALVSDSGTPLISDPGFKLVRECLLQAIPVDTIPGPASAIAALTLSGLPTDKFLFLGYPPEKASHRQQLLDKLTLIDDCIKVTYIMFVAPHKLVKVLEEILLVFGDIDVTLACELTKIHQTLKTQKINQWLENFSKRPPKGELTLLFRLDNPN